ncbi:hypothetical protein ACEPPN_000923 [Leptodophora sp. 'Broadleaf-Isolate-01']
MSGAEVLVPWLKRIVSTLKEENVIFGLILKRLLLPIQDDLEARDYTLEDPDLSLFQDGHVQEKLRMVLPDYSWIMERIFIISTTTKKILEIFAGNDGEVKLPEPGTIQYEVDRLKQSFSQELDTLIKDLKDANNALTRYTTIQGQTVSSQPRVQKHTRLIKTLQAQASQLYLGLRLNIQCSSAGHCHKCAIAVEWYKSSTGSIPALRLLLTETTHLKQLEWDIESIKAPQHVLSQNDKVTSPDPIDALKKEITIREKHENLVKEAEKKSIGIAAVAATEAILNPKNDEVEKIWLERRGKRLTKGSKKTDKARKPFRNRFNPLGLKKPRDSESSNGMAKKTLTDGLQTQPPEPPSLPDPVVTTALPRKRQGVRFADEAAGESTPPLRTPGSPKADSGNTSNLQELKACDILTGQLNHLVSGYLPLSTDRIRFKFCRTYPDLLEQSEACLHPLRELSEKTPKISDRLQMGSQLGLLLVSLGMSGWIPQGWAARNITVLQSPATAPKRGFTNIPYFSYPVLSEILERQSASELPNRDFSKLAIFSFGVLILELLTNVEFEQTEYWKTIRNPDTGWDWENIAGALRWKQAVQMTQPDFLADAIERCILSQFGNSPDLNDVAFCQEFIDFVVEPLERYAYSSTQILDK